MAISTSTTHSGPDFRPDPQPRFRASLRLYLIVAFALLSILPVGVATVVEITRFRSQAEQQIANQLTSIVEAKESSIETNLAQDAELLRSVTSSASMRGDTVALLAGSGPDVSLQSRVTARLEEALAVQEDFNEYFIYDRGGTIIASTEAAQVGKVVTRAPYFEGSLTAEQVQAPFYEVGSASLNMMLTFPVTNANDEVVGVLAGRLNLDALGALMAQRAGLGETGETYLVSLENSYFVTPSRFEGFPLTRSYSSVGIENALAGQDGVQTYTNYRGQRVIGAYRWLPELQAGLIAEIEQAEAFSALQDAVSTSLIVGIVAAFIAGGIGLFVALGITRPISELTRVTRRLIEGEVDARAEVKQRNEVGELAFAFNTMTDQLQQTLTELDKSAREARLASAMAREANRLKSEFLATMSHELRTPLNAIIGFAEILLAGMAGPLQSEHEHKITRIHLNSKRLLNLINDLLDLAKIEAGRVDVLHEPFSPTELANKLGAEMESLAERRALSFEVRVDPSLPETIMGDSTRVEQAVSNLLSNAFKFTEVGSVRLQMDVGNTDSWRISVTDSGIGIPPHALEYIFDEFRQADTGSQRAYGGSGLGLSITRNLARIMGGDIRVSSKIGEGSTFTIELPLVVPARERIGAEVLA